jgi:tetratricopeptide (TPR) repeat protein
MMRVVVPWAWRLNFRSMSFVVFILFTLLACNRTSEHDISILSRAENIVETKSDSAIALLNTIKAPQEMKRSDYAHYALIMAQAKNKRGLSLTSDSLIRIAFDFYSESKDLGKKAKAYFYMSRAEHDDGNPKDAVNYLLKAEEFASKDKNVKLLGLIYSDKALVYYEQSAVDSAINAYRQAKNFFYLSHDSSNIAIASVQIARCYNLLQNYDSALTYCRLSAQEAIKHKNAVLYAMALRFQGVVCYGMKDYGKARYYLKLAINLSKDDYDIGKYLNLGMVYLSMNMPDSARYYFLESVKQKGDLSIKSSCYHYLLDLSLARGNVSDVRKYVSVYTAMVDSLYKSSIHTSLIGLEQKFNYVKIANANKTLTIHQQNTYILLLILFLIIAIGVSFYLFDSNRKKQAISRLLKDQLNLQQAKLDKLALLQKIARLRIIPKSNLEQTGSQFLKLFDTEIEMTSTDSTDLFDSIDMAYNNLSQRLIGKFPQLNKKELLFCCLRYADFDNSSIATILELNINSVYRYNALIRDKMGYPKNIKLEKILAEF